jgi:hypothetical protein
MSYDHVLLHGCEIVENSGVLIVPYPEFVPLNRIVYAEDVDYNDDDHNYVEEEHEADEAEQPSRKRKREGDHDKYITYDKANNRHNVSVCEDGKQQYVGYFPTQEEAVVARDAFLRGETVIKSDVKESAHGKHIYYHKASKKYKVQATKDGKRHYVGRFPTQEEAVVARDAYLKGETVIKPAVVKSNESAHGKGISYKKANNKYQVQVYKDGKTSNVGSFPTQEEAIVARDAFMKGETVINPSQRASGVERKRKHEELSSSSSSECDDNGNGSYNGEAGSNM